MDLIKTFSLEGVKKLIFYKWWECYRPLLERTIQHQNHTIKSGPFICK